MTETVLTEAPFEGFIDDALTGPISDLVELWRHTDALAALPDAASASGPRALEAAQAIAKVRHVADALLAQYAARLDDLSSPGAPSRFARWKGFPNAAALLSSAAGLSVADAGKLIGMGHAMAATFQPDAVVEPVQEAEQVRVEQAPVGEADPLEPLLSAPVPQPEPQVPAVQRPLTSPLVAAIRSGLGTEKATVIRRTLEDMTVNRAAAEELLVRHAPQLTIVKLRRLCLETFAELDPVGYADREARQWRDRRVSIFDEPDGMVTFYAKLPPVLAAPLKVWLEAEQAADVFSQRDLPQDQQRTLGQILADAFVTMARHCAGCTKATSRPKSTIIVHASRGELENGSGFAAIEGIEAPITLATALLEAVDAEFAALLLDDDGVPLKLGRTRRSANRDQRIVAMLRDKGCAQCSRATSRCDSHHVIEWGSDGDTDVDNLVMLCVGCHHRLHDEGWQIVIENNHVWFIPPAKLDPLRRRQPGSSVRPT